MTTAEFASQRDTDQQECKDAQQCSNDDSRPMKRRRGDDEEPPTSHAQGTPGACDEDDHEGHKRRKQHQNLHMGTTFFARLGPYSDPEEAKEIEDIVRINRMHQSCSNMQPHVQSDAVGSVPDEDTAQKPSSINDYDDLSPAKKQALANAVKQLYRLVVLDRSDNGEGLPVGMMRERIVRRVSALPPTTVLVPSGSGSGETTQASFPGGMARKSELTATYRHLVRGPVSWPGFDSVISTRRPWRASEGGARKTNKERAMVPRLLQILTRRILLLR